MKPSACLRLIAAVLLLPVALPSCGLFRGKKQPPEKTEEEPKGPKPIGTIALVNTEARFVLIHLIHRASPPPTGLVMRCISATTGQETGQLIITPEKKGSHMAADIKSGTPAISDIVISDIGAAAPAAPGAAAAAAAALPADLHLPGRLVNGLPDPAAPDSGAVLTPSQPSGPVPSIKPGQ